MVKKPVILLIDDDDFTSIYLERLCMLKKIPASIVRCAYASELRDIADIESFAAVFCDLRLPDVVDESKWVLEVYGRYPDTFFISGDPGLVDVGIKIYDKGSDSISGLLDTIEFS